MFRRIGLCILAASAAFGAVINDDQTATTVRETVEPAPNPVPSSYVPRISEAELANAPFAPIYTVCKKPGQFVLTFDDGPNPETTPIALDYLKAHNITAAFFINSRNYGDLEADPAAVDLVKREFNEGHDIGSHTLNHVNLFKAIDRGNMEENIDKMTDKIEEIIGVKPAFFRPPDGDGGYPDHGDPEKKRKNDIIQKYLGASGYGIVMWEADTRDWEQKGDIEYSLRLLDEKLKAPGVSPETHSFISLMHDVHPTSVNDLLPKVVEHVSQLGYTFVSLTECLGIQSAYQPDTKEINNNLLSDNSTSITHGKLDKNDEESSASIIQVKMIYSLVAVILSFFFFF